MKNLFLLIIPFLLFSCSKKRESNLPRILVKEVDNVIEVNSKHMLESRPRLLGLNFTKDTTIIMHKNRNFNKSIIHFKKDTLLPKYDLKIIIDTTYNFQHNEFQYKWLNFQMIADSLKKLNLKSNEFEKSLHNKYLHKIFKMNDNHVKCYPLLIFNDENNDCYLSNDSNSFQLIQEAKDIDGKWKPIEYLHNLSSCFTNSSYYKLNPKKYLATAIIKYHGDFKTKIRVKIRLNNNYYYSNEIEGYINQSQFNDEFLNLNFYKAFDHDLEDEWFKVKKEHSLLKNKLK